MAYVTWIDSVTSRTHALVPPPSSTSPLFAPPLHLLGTTVLVLYPTIMGAPVPSLGCCPRPTMLPAREYRGEQLLHDDGGRHPDPPPCPRRPSRANRSKPPSSERRERRSGERRVLLREVFPLCRAVAIEVVPSAARWVPLTEPPWGQVVIHGEVIHSCVSFVSFRFVSFRFLFLSFRWV